MCVYQLYMFFVPERNVFVFVNRTRKVRSRSNIDTISCQSLLRGHHGHSSRAGPFLVALYIYTNNCTYVSTIQTLHTKSHPPHTSKPPHSF